MSEHGFYAAFEGEKIVYGAQRPGYPFRNIREDEIREWVDFMKSKDIKRVVCLLPQEQLEYYTITLLEFYKREFGDENVLWAPIEDFHLCDKEILRKLHGSFSVVDLTYKKL